MRIRWDAVRTVAMSLGVVVGGTLFLAGVLNLVLHLRDEPGTPPLATILLVTAAGMLLAGVPLWLATREMLRGGA